MILIFYNEWLTRFSTSWGNEAGRDGSKASQILRSWWLMLGVSYTPAGWNKQKINLSLQTSPRRTRTELPMASHFFSICLEAASNAMKFAHSPALQAASKANHQHLDTAGEWSYQSSHLGKRQNIQWKVKHQDPQLVDSWYEYSVNCGDQCYSWGLVT